MENLKNSLGILQRYKNTVPFSQILNDYIEKKFEALLASNKYEIFFVENEPYFINNRTDEQAFEAMKEDSTKGKYKGNNTTVETIEFSAIGTVSRYYLHGNQIAEYIYSTKVLTVSSEGWRSNTTKSRLNSLLPKNVFIYQKNFTWYITTSGTTERWNGSKNIQL